MKDNQWKNDSNILIHSEPSFNGQEFCDDEITADILLEKEEPCKIEGIVRYDECTVARDVELGLYVRFEGTYRQIAQTCTDEKGRYKFVLFNVRPNEEFFIAVIVDENEDIDDFRVILKDRCKCKCKNRNCNWTF